MAETHSVTESTADETNLRLKGFLGLGFFLAIIGALISIYTLWHHLEVKAVGGSNAFCNINATFNCDDIVLSPYSELVGNPLGLYGFAYFAALATLLITAGVKAQYRQDALEAYRFLAFLGLIVSIVLGSISAFIIGKGCLNCIGVYTVTLLQVGLVLVGGNGVFAKSLSIARTGNGLTFAAIPFAVALGAYSVYKPAPKSFHPDLPEGNGSSQANRVPMLSATPVSIEVNRSPYSGFGEDFRTGSDDAKVVIVEFADFQCPACSQAYKTLKGLKAEFGSQIQVVFKNYPLDMKCNKALSRKIHEYACDAALLARCVGVKGNFQKMHDHLFEHQSELSDAKLKEWARVYGLNDQEIDACLNSTDVVNKVRDDIAQGDKAGVDSTPTLFINGFKVIGGRSEDELRKIISDKLSE